MQSYNTSICSHILRSSFNSDDAIGLQLFLKQTHHVYKVLNAKLMNEFKLGYKKFKLDTKKENF